MLFFCRRIAPRFHPKEKNVDQLDRKRDGAQDQKNVIDDFDDSIENFHDIPFYSLCSSSGSAFPCSILRSARFCIPLPRLCGFDSNRRFSSVGGIVNFLHTFRRPFLQILDLVPLHQNIIRLDGFADRDGRARFGREEQFEPAAPLSPTDDEGHNGHLRLAREQESTLIELAQTRIIVDQMPFRIHMHQAALFQKAFQLFQKTGISCLLSAIGMTPARRSTQPASGILKLLPKEVKITFSATARSHSWRNPANIHGSKR